MPYASPIKTLPEALFSSTGLAALASLGIHGLLWAVLPVLPLDSESVEAELQRTVGLVELTPAEQSRLPQVSTSPVTLPPFATQPSVLPPLPAPPSLSLLPPFATQQGVLPPLPPLPSFNLLPPSGIAASNYPPLAMQPGVLPPLPPPPSFNLLPPSGTPIPNYPLSASLPQPQTFRVPFSAPFQNNRSLPSAFPFGKLPASASRQTVPLRQFLPPPPPLFTPPPNSSLPYLALKPAERFSLPDPPPIPIPVSPSNLENQLAASAQTENPSESEREERLVALQQRLRQQSAQTENPSESAREERLAALQQKLRQQSYRNPTGSTSQPFATANPEAKAPPASARTENPSERGREERLAALQQKLRQQSYRNPTGSTSQPFATANPEAKAPPASARTENPPERGREERLAALQQRLRQQSDPNSPGSMSAAAVERNQQLRAWAERQNRVQQNNSNVVTKAPIYKTFKTCKREIDGSVAVLGVVVNPQGKIESGPDLISKTGAADTAQAKNFVRGYGFPRTSNPINQQFRLQYKYDTGNCAEANRKPAPQNTTTEQPKPAPQNTTTEQPKPAPQNTTTEQPKPAPEDTTTEQPTS